MLENSCRADEHECPFGRTSVELVKLLCEVLRIGEAPSEQGQNYHPMFFTHDHPFEEFFCICIILLNKTWKEMRATIEDFVKVSCICRNAEYIVSVASLLLFPFAQWEFPDIYYISYCFSQLPIGTEVSLFAVSPTGIVRYLHSLI